MEEAAAAASSVDREVFGQAGADEYEYSTRTDPGWVSMAFWKEYRGCGFGCGGCVCACLKFGGVTKCLAGFYARGVDVSFCKDGHVGQAFVDESRHVCES